MGALYRRNSKRPDERWLVTYTDTYGGYVTKPTDEEIQEDLDQMQRNWNRYSSSNRYRRPVTVRALKEGACSGTRLQHIPLGKRSQTLVGLRTHRYPRQQRPFSYRTGRTRRSFHLRHQI